MLAYLFCVAICLVFLIDGYRELAVIILTLLLGMIMSDGRYIREAKSRSSMTSKPLNVAQLRLPSEDPDVVDDARHDAASGDQIPPAGPIRPAYDDSRTITDPKKPAWAVYPYDPALPRSPPHDAHLRAIGVRDVDSGNTLMIPAADEYQLINEDQFAMARADYMTTGHTGDARIAGRMSYMAQQPKRAIEARSRFNKYSTSNYFANELTDAEYSRWWDDEETELML